MRQEKAEKEQILKIMVRLHMLEEKVLELSCLYNQRAVGGLQINLVFLCSLMSSLRLLLTFLLQSF